MTARGLPIGLQPFAFAPALLALHAGVLLRRFTRAVITTRVSSEHNATMAAVRPPGTR